MLFDAPPSIGGNLRRAVDEIAAANGVTNTVTHLVYSHHHADHGAASSLFDGDVVRIGHEETRRLLLRDDDPSRPLPEVTFADRYTLEVGGERVELAWHGSNHCSRGASRRRRRHRRHPALGRRACHVRLPRPRWQRFLHHRNRVVCTAEGSPCAPLLCVLKQAAP